MRYMLTAMLVSCALVLAMDPPALVWEKQFYEEWDHAYFENIKLDQNGNLFVTGRVYSYTNPSLENFVAFLFDQDGNKLWEVPHAFAGEFGYDGVALADGSYVITGSATEDSSSSSAGLCIHKISPNGETIWSRIYDYPETKEEGYSITSLPDGGFAVCGKVNGTGLQNGEAWILRTDSQGDTLWTRRWASSGYPDSFNYGKTVLFGNGELCILASGISDSLPTHGSHLLFYNLDGDFLRGTDYPEMYYRFPKGMCQASDGGYTFVTDENPVICHTDHYGETLWWHSIYNYGVEEGYDVIRTMDSGYLFCGWGGKSQEPSSDNDCTHIPPAGVDTGWTEDGWLVKFDEEGNQQWEIKNEAETTHNHYYSVVQLPEGGYIACGMYGGNGYLARYAPETGISEPDPAGALSFEVSPNPCSSFLSVSFTLPGQGNASVRVYDLRGRLVSTVADSEFPAGSNTVQWSVPGELSSGCYFVQYNSEFRSRTESVALIR